MEVSGRSTGFALDRIILYNDRTSELEATKRRNKKKLNKDVINWSPSGESKS